MSPPPNALVLVSGGLDSTTALYWALDQGYLPLAFSVAYHNRTAKEWTAMQRICTEVSVPLHVVDMPFIKDLEDLHTEGASVPSPAYATPGFIPFKNLLFYAVAAYFADTRNISILIGGHTRDDLGVYPDTSAEFFLLLTQLCQMSAIPRSGTSWRMILPFQNMSKVEVIKIGSRLNVPFALTWSCYLSGETPCGICKACRERARAFALAQLADSPH